VIGRPTVRRWIAGCVCASVLAWPSVGAARSRLDLTAAPEDDAEPDADAEPSRAEEAAAPAGDETVSEAGPEEIPPDDVVPTDDDTTEDNAAAGLSVSPRGTERDSTRKATTTSPSAAAVRSAPRRVTVGVGLAPSAPGSRTERALLAELERTIAASADPIAKVRHVSAGAGEPRLVCRERRDDLVVMIGYVAQRADPVVLTHDCRLDRALALRSRAAVTRSGLLASLWDEHETLVRQGIRERRGIRRLTPTARGVIIASVAVAVVGVAVGILVANALRDEKVVINVSP
jgi:hypothetical protein